MTDMELFQEYKNDPTVEKRNELVEKYLYMVDILIRKYLGKGVEYEGTMERVNSIQLGLCPGMTAFATDFMAVECSIGVMGLKYKWVNQETNRVEKGKNRLGGANFKINLLSVNIGMTFYL